MKKDNNKFFKFLRYLFLTFVIAFGFITIVATGGGGNKDNGGSGSDNTNTTVIPSVPNTINATGSDGAVTISWDAVSGATSYNIYWSTTSGVTKINGTKITGATNPYSHTGLTNNTTYYYVVTAVNSAGESAESPQSSATPPLAGWYQTWLNPGNPGMGYNLYATDTELYAATNNGVYSTTDTGNPWISMGPTGKIIHDVITSNQYILAATDSGVYRSSDNGNTWLPGAGLSDMSVYHFAKNSTYVFALTWANGIFRSGDDGATWQFVLGPANTSPEHYYSGGDAIYAVGEKIFAGGINSDIWFSTDNGDTWEFREIKQWPGNSPFCFYYDNGILYAGGTGLYSSTDLGNTWQLNGGITFDAKGNIIDLLTIYDIVSYNNTLIASAMTESIYISRDNGVSWTSFNEGALNSGWTFAAIAIKPPYIWALTAGNGNAYRRPLTDIVP
jgi:hypothetical protein